MNRHTMIGLASVVGLCLVMSLPAGTAVAQQKQQVSFKAPAETSKYTQQLNLDVGDVASHIVRIWELHRTYPSNAPVINGLKLVEDWERGIGDRIDGTGDGTFFRVFVMENGDKFFSRQTVTVQSNSGKLNASIVGYITGGTGKFAGMQGIIRGSADVDLKTGFNEAVTNIEYSVGR